MEKTQLINCACGCEKQLYSIDKWGKKRKFILGHHPHSREKKHINHDKTILNTTKNRFYAKILLPNEFGCMEWISKKKSNKRAHFILTFGEKRSSLNASRYSYKLHYGINPGNFYVCHSCDNPKCVAPEHLWLGTQKDNMQDMLLKNRHYKKRKNK